MPHRAMRRAHVALALLLCALPAHANLAKTVIGILAPDYADSLAVIECIVDKGSLNETVAKACVEKAADAQTKKIVASDPKLKSIVDTVLAANAGDWMRVLEIVGTDGLKTVVCSGALGVGGAVSDLVCGSAFEVAKPVIKPALKAVLDGDWWALVTLLGPSSACTVIPGGDVKDVVCGTFAQALNEVGKFAKGGVNAGADALISFGEAISGQTQHMPREKYYEMYWHPLIHVDVRIILNSGKPSHKVEFDHCVGYFDSHKASKESGEKWCGQMRDQVAAHVKAIVPAIHAAPAGYYAGKLKAQVPRLMLEQYHAQSTDYKALQKVMLACRGDVQNKVEIPGKLPTHYQTPAPYTAWDWACAQARTTLEQALVAYKKQGAPPLLAKLVNAGCKPKKLDDARLYAVCDSYDGYAACKAEMSSLRAKAESHCGVDGAAAAPKLAKKVAAELGAKRCAVSAQNARLVECSRPWKKNYCDALVGKYQGSVSYAYAVTCAAKSDPGFEAARKQAQAMLNTLNGVQEAGTVQQPGGKTGKLVLVPPGGAPCRHGMDPLAIACPGNPKAPLEKNVNLPACVPDPNRDGADAPCYAGPLTNLAPASPAVVQQPVPAAVPSPGASREYKPAAQARTTVPPAVGAPAAAGVTPPARAPVAAPSKPDLAASPDVQLLRRGGAEKGQWGGSIAVEDSAAPSTQNGKCYFGLHFEVRNTGGAPAPVFQVALSAEGEPPGARQAGPLAPGASSSHEIYVNLRPGANVLRLRVDSQQQVSEADESNNAPALTVNVKGSCGGAAAGGRLRQPATPGR
jgi:hypothetical protein